MYTPEDAVISDPSPETGTVETPDTTATTDATAASSTATGATDSDSPTEGDDRAEIIKRAERLEGKKPDAADSPATETTDDDSDSDDPAKQDEPAGKKEPERKADGLSEAEFSKKFDEHPDWKRFKELTPTKNAEVRELARGFIERENKLRERLEKSKPAVDVVSRITKSGVDINNTVQLIEGWQRGDKQARKILQELIADFDQRTGEVLSSPELLEEEKTLKQQMADGEVDESYAKRRLAELKELEKSRLTVKQTEAEKAEAAKRNQQESLGKLFKQCDEAVAVWDKTAAKNPDYTPEIKELVHGLADKFISEKGEQLGRYLQPAEVVECLKQAHEKVLGTFTKALPARQVIKPLGNQNNGSSRNSRREPTSEREAQLQRMAELESRL